MHRGQAGHATGHGLHQRHRNAFLVAVRGRDAGQGEHVRPAQCGLHIGLVAAAANEDALIQPVPCDETLQLLLQRAVADDFQLDRDIALREPGHGFAEIGHAFLLDQPCDAQHAQGPRWRWRIVRAWLETEAVQVDAHAMDLDLLRRAAQRLQLALPARADRQHPLAAGEQAPVVVGVAREHAVPRQVVTMEHRIDRPLDQAQRAQVRREHAGGTEVRDDGVRLERLAQAPHGAGEHQRLRGMAVQSNRQGPAHPCTRQARHHVAKALQQDLPAA